MSSIEMMSMKTSQTPEVKWSSSQMLIVMKSIVKVAGYLFACNCLFEYWASSIKRILQHYF